MASGRQKVSDGDIIALEKELAHRFEGIKGQLRDLQSIIDSLEGHWKGIGAGAFNAKQTEINERMVRIGNILAKYIEAMSSTRKIKDSTEDEVRSQVQSIDVNYGGSHSALSSY
ncbi:WXG100 family type VII secretion target [Streptomyces sp. 5-8]|uniref:WXG100 family type VII secretion target n=1 Tax=Streptomyces musisoli TaxID=2802280 RepID=A0ABS1P794_9ACTN|nr:MULTISPECIES: WXG100 family type VII secretion target [Streptomyces]MBL1108054.1 WXG100 family type VII secretion target [Streptomyces musisoli]MBY8841419.1 WXG100 family type VII secretion target [Streptomyces sp. SP2-10]